MTNKSDKQGIFSIGQVAARTGLSAHTLRYYEANGLLAPRREGTGAYRCYSEDDIAWLAVLISLRDTGMPLGTIQRFVSLWQDGISTLPERRALLEAHLRDVNRQFETLCQHRERIAEKIERCHELEASGDENAYGAWGRTCLDALPGQSNAKETGNADIFDRRDRLRRSRGRRTVTESGT